MFSINSILICSYVLLLYGRTQGLLYPKDTPTRETKSLNGLWKFSINEKGIQNSSLDLALMPVPSSYNDVLTSLEGRDHFGSVVYERAFYIPKEWLAGGRIWIRFGSVCYSAIVYINGKQVASHDIGHLPFEADITKFVTRNKNEIKVVVDNKLTGSTIPQGSHETLPGGRVRQTYTFDFFNYAGIDRPVFLHHTPSVFIKDIVIRTYINHTTGIVNYKVDVENSKDNLNANNITCQVSVVDEDEKVVATQNGLQGNLVVTKAKLWWPYLMSDTPGYQYTLRVSIYSSNVLLDTYDELFGIRVLSWDSNSFKVNGKPVYLRGFGRHEDSDIRGKGLDLPLIIRDYNLMKWVGANSYRTSHYPYAEEIMDLADKLGIMILNEVPAVNTRNYNNDLLENHKRSLTQLYERDKNRPSVFMWSIANEPDTRVDASKEYYRHVAAHIKSLDNTRPITLAMYYDAEVDRAGEFLDIISFNKYEGWYIYPGQLDVIEKLIVERAEAWRKKHSKPLLITEYGADTTEGLHLLPSDMWSEEYQTGLMSSYFKAFDKLKKEGWFIGEMIWNFADFKTASDIRRVGLNKKGIFTRQRQPKNSAHFMRKRYWSLANQLNNVSMPEDIAYYVMKTNFEGHIEL